MPDAGDVVILNFPGVLGTKRRPAVVLSSQMYHSARPDVIVGLITSQTGKANSPTDHILSDWNAAGLHAASAFRAFITTMPRTAISTTIGRLSVKDLQAVQDCVRKALTI